MIFLGCLFRKEDEYIILEKSQTRVSNAVNTLQWSIIHGLDKFESLNIINVLPVGTYPNHYKSLFLENKQWSHNEIGSNLEIGGINLPILKQYSRYRKVKKELKSQIEYEKNIIIYSTYLPYLKAVSKLNNNVHITLIVADLPEFYDLAKVGLFRKLLRKVNNYFVYKYLARIDSFVLLTEKMKDRLQVGERPFTVMEGIADTESISQDYSIELGEQNNKKIILYTGTLHYKYGIASLLEAFGLIENNDYELWICGSGEAEEDIKRLSSKDKRIRFFGFLVKDEVLKLQQQATVLVNPRPNDGEYTKYSFPSKTMEYLVSGKPVLMHRLDGIPDEYDEYIYYFNGKSAKDIANRLIEVLEMKDDKRKEFGEAARQFVIKNKNNVTQASKILKMIKG